MRPIQALVWEQWRQTRWQIAVAAALLAAYLSDARTGEWVTKNYFYSQRVHPEHLTWFVLLGLIPLLFMNLGAKNVGESFPRRQFTLPVSSGCLAAVQVLYKLLVVLVFGTVIAILNGLRFGPEVFSWQPVAIALAVTSGIQATVCLGRGGTFLSAIPSVVLLLFSVALAMKALVMDSLEENPKSAAILLFSVAAAGGLALWNARRARIGAGESPKALTPKPELSSARSAVAKRPFRSKLTAQIWFEWRRSSLWVLPVLLMVPFAALGLLSPNAFVLWAVSFPVLVMLFGFYLLWETPPRRAFALARPVSTVQIATAKLWAGGAAIGASWLLVMAAFSMLATLSSHWRTVWGSNFGEIFVLLVTVLYVSWMALTIGRLALVLYIAGLIAAGILIATEHLFQGFFTPQHELRTVVLACAAALTALATLYRAAVKRNWPLRHYLPGLILYVIGIAALLYMVEITLRPRYLEAVCYPLVGAAVVLIIFFSETYLRTVVTRRQLRFVATAQLCIIMLFIGAYTLYLALTAHEPPGARTSFSVDEMALTAAFAMLGFTPLAWVPLVVHWQRHR